jgi:integrase
MLDDGPRLKLNKSGYWTLVSAERGEDGKWRTRTVSCHTRDQSEAQQFRRAFLAIAEPSSDQTVGRLITEYLDHGRDRQITNAQFAALKPVKELLGAYRPEEITLELQRAYRKQRQVADGTIRRELGALIAVLNWAVKFDKLEATQRRHVERPEPPPAREAWLNEGDEARLWGLAAEDRDRLGRLSLVGLFVCLALGTGARSGAIYALTWDRVDLKAGTVDFRVPGERVTKKLKVKTVINERLLPILQRARTDYPFARKVISQLDIRRGVNGFLRKHGFSHITPHAFRHTFVTLSLRAGVDPWTVAELVGMSLNVLDTVYGHHVPDERLRKAANRRFT